MIKHDLTGKRFGMLVAIRELPERKDRRVVWECLCDCGTTKHIVSSHLMKGDSVSCGCKRRAAKEPLARLKESVVVNQLNGCWEWKKRIDGGGYGRLKIQLGTRASFRMDGAHRYAWTIFFGNIPEGMHVLHRCDNRRCCNPDHLFLGSHADNMRDMVSKGRAGWQLKRVNTDKMVQQP